MLGLTDKGLATLLLEGDLEEEDLLRAGQRVLEIDEKKFKFPMEGWFKRYIREAFKETLLAVRHKINLKYFDEKWFLKIFLETFFEIAEKVIEKQEREGVWKSDEEGIKMLEGLMQNFTKSDYFKTEKGRAP